MKYDTDVQKPGTVQGVNTAEREPKLTTTKVMSHSTALAVTPPPYFQASQEAARLMRDKVVETYLLGTIYLLVALYGAPEHHDKRGWSER